MAIYTFTDGFLSVAGTDLSDHVTSITLDTGVEAQDKTAMGDSSRQSIAGLSTWSVTAEIQQDFAAGELDAIIAALTNNEAALVIRPTSSAVGTTNPEWTGTGLLTSYNPISGAVGDLAMASVTFEAASDLARATS